MTKDEQIASMVQTLAETFRAQITPLSAKAYILTLGELSSLEIRESGRRALRECEHMPAPAQLLRLGLKARKEGQETAVACTSRMLDAMKPSSYPTPEQLAAIRDDWKAHVRNLADGMTPDARVQAAAAMTPEQEAARKDEINAQMAARGVTLPEGTA